MNRTHVVWVSLLASMTAVGGLLLVSDPRVEAHGGLRPLVADGRAERSGISVIFDTESSIERGAWRGIVIHHSGTLSGSPESIARDHADQGLAGLGYHFVLGNGRGCDDGSVHIGPRWDRQVPGAHVAGPSGDLLNRTHIGVCLVGDGDRRSFSPAQLAALVELVSALQRELGLPADAVVLHRDVAATTAPGRMFPEAAFRAELAAAR